MKHLCTSRGQAFFSLKTQFENVGDALINRELVKLTASQLPVVLDLSRCPQTFQKSLGLEGIPGISIARNSPTLLARMILSRLIGRPTYYFLSPGGYVGEKEGRPLLSAWFNTGILIFFSLLGIRICHLGVSYERLGPNLTRLLRIRSRLLYAHLARDNRTKQYADLERIRVTGVMPDLAFGAARADTAWFGNTSSTIAFSFRGDQFEGQEAAVASWVTELDRLLPRNVGVRFVCQVERDNVLMKHLCERVLASGRREAQLHCVWNDINGCVDAYAKCSHVISNRLHALLAGALGGCKPVAAIDSHHNAKIKGVFEDLQITTNILFISQSDSAASVASMLARNRFSSINAIEQRAKLIMEFGTVLGSAPSPDGAKG